MEPALGVESEARRGSRKKKPGLLPQASESLASRNRPCMKARALPNRNTYTDPRPRNLHIGSRQEGHTGVWHGALGIYPLV
jgi:hypothetical protein